MKFSGPLWRVAGSFASWFLFTLCFTLLFLGSTVVMGLGGYCASGGPYVIETQCPDAVARRCRSRSPVGSRRSWSG
ncbi:MAG: hypothetical protein R2717_02260 [Schumannella sp.]